MKIEKALEILKNKNDYIVPNSDMDEAIGFAIKFMEEQKLYNNIIDNYVSNNTELIRDYPCVYKTGPLLIKEQKLKELLDSYFCEHFRLAYQDGTIQHCLGIPIKILKEETKDE